MRNLWAAVLCAAVLAGASSAEAAVIFEETFDDDSNFSLLNFTAFDQFTVADGAVDYIRSGQLGIVCADATGGCVDLDGSLNGTPASRLVSTAINFQNGVNYTLSFDLSGNQRNGADDALDVIIDGLLNLSIVDIAADWSFGAYTYNFTAAADLTSSIVFLIAGASDFVGPVLDNVLLVSNIYDNDDASAVPLPAAAPLMLAGLAGMAGFSRKRRKA